MTAVRVALVLALGCGPGGALAAEASPAAGAAYATHCLVCHGADLRGVEGLGVNLTASPFVARTPVRTLAGFLAAGRLPDAADSVTGRPMPGFGWLAPDELDALAAFIKAGNGG